MKKYGFFGGCFNPVTNAHINLANIVVQKFGLDKLIFVPMGDKYQKQNLANEQHRYEMLKIAISKQERLEVSDMELNLPYALTTLQAFQKVQEKYKDIAPYFIIGADNLIKLTNSNDFKTLAQNYKYIVLERGIQTKNQIVLNPVLEQYRENFNVLENNEYEGVSSSQVRNLLQIGEDKNIMEIVPKDVYEYIKRYDLY